jgi:outer membrane protein insertion porin family
VPRRFICLLLLLLPAALLPAWAQEPELVFKKVAVMPVAVISKTPMEHLGERMLQEMQDRLKSEGFTLISQGDLKKELAPLKEPLTEARAQEIGRKLGADLVVMEQLLVVGDVLSLEARVLDLTGKAPPATLKTQGVGLKTLPDLSRKLAQETALKVLGKERVTRIEVKGNRRIEKDAILGVMQTREGDLLSPARLRDDLKSIYKMGYFTDVKFDVNPTPEGLILTVLVEEKPAIKEIITKGNKKVKRDKVLEVMDLKPFSVASEAAIQENVNKILKLYRDKGFYEARVTPELVPISKTEVNLVLNIDEGGKLAIKEINFTGNKAFKAKELRKVMETKEKTLLVSWITGSGVLLKDTLERDLEKISAFYYNHGYIKARVEEPKVDIKGKYIYITIPIVEGPQFKVGEVDITGDLLEDKKKLLEKLDLPKEKIYSREVLQKDMTTLGDIYADQGYADVDITPLIRENDKDLKVNVLFDISKGQKVYFDRIDIVGNVKTRDKVIRRELRVYEQELFSSSKVKDSIKNLRRLEYFEEVNFTTSPGTAANRRNLKISVKERPTGTFGLGAGYSTQDRLVGMVEVSQNNLFGRGQQLKVQGILGAISKRFRASFTEPYLFDRPLAFGVDAFDWERSYSEYTRKSKGGDLRLSHPLRWRYTRIYTMYRFENVDLEDLRRRSSPILKEAARIHNTSSSTITLRRDSRDSLFAPTHGTDNSLSVELAGLGGDTAFLRYIAESGWYFPFWFNTVFVVHGRAGYMQGLSWGAMPAYEKFYLGGIDTIRGFAFAQISPRDPRTHERIGGDKFVQLNVEERFPLYKKLGLMGTVFFDAGNVYGAHYIGPPLRPTAGVGIRWFSPLGPLRVEWGYNLTKHPFEKQSVWEFTMGGSF